MKIAHVVSTFPPYHGGMGSVARDLARQLVALGEDVTVLTPTTSEDIEESIDGVRVLRIHSRFSHGNASSCRWVLQWLQGYDVIHLHWPFIGGAEWIWWGYYRRRLLSPLGHLPKLVLHYHMDLVAPGYRSLIFSLVERFILPRLIRYASVVVTSSQEYLEASPPLNAQKRTEPPLYRAISLGVDIDRFQPGEANRALAARWGIEEGMVTIGFVGSIDSAHYFKGIEQLLAAFSILVQTVSRVRFALLIVGEGNQLAHYEQVVRDGGLDNSVHFVGRVSDDELPEYYRLMDCLVLPSTTRSEAFGLVLLEAMACGRAVVASNLPGVRTLVQEGVNGRLVNPGDEQDLAQVLIDLASSSDTLKRMGENGREQATHSYSWSRVAQDWKDLYGSL